MWPLTVLAGWLDKQGVVALSSTYRLPSYAMIIYQLENHFCSLLGTINQSLLTLGRVITSLVERAPHIPYRYIS